MSLQVKENQPAICRAALAPRTAPANDRSGLSRLTAKGTMTRFVGVRSLAVRVGNSMTTNVAITALDIRIGPAPDSFSDRTLKSSKEYRFEV
jgi:hypothetical protein